MRTTAVDDDLVWRRAEPAGSPTAARRQVLYLSGQLAPPCLQDLRDLHDPRVPRICNPIFPVSHMPRPGQLRNTPGPWLNFTTVTDRKVATVTLAGYVGSAENSR